MGKQFYKQIYREKKCLRGRDKVFGLNGGGHGLILGGPPSPCCGLHNHENWHLRWWLHLEARSRGFLIASTHFLEPSALGISAVHIAETLRQ
jgi:hypothetical protein